MDFIMDRDLWINLLNGIEDQQIFTLSEHFNNLTLNDTGGSTNHRSNFLYDSGLFQSFLRSFRHSTWSQSINEQLRAPFIELPRHFMESSFKRKDISIALGFRFLPGMNEFKLNEFSIPQSSFNRYTFIRNSLGLFYSGLPLSPRMFYNLGHAGAGLRAAANSNDCMPGVLVEVISNFKGLYGRFLVFVSLGIGCTVWYGFTQCPITDAPMGELFSPLSSYEQFFDVNHTSPIFRKISFVETQDLSASVASAFENELPFAEINIPASGNVLMAVGLGVMVAFFLAVGIVPNVSSACSSINIQR